MMLFDNRNAFSPTDHIWISEKIDWVKVADGLPQFPEGRTGKSDSTSLNRTLRLSFCMGMILSENRYPLFGIMP